ncbi:folate family ECF transporter S component [Acholeplasma granularum]|uniref:folate family ECF transporter S component n=1 Tax=Acholeplasma granularum TaxID=264635 RepID=UPI000471AB1E|nr:folate family ECF transporter S component [Acholeplasma granularum]
MVKKEIRKLTLAATLTAFSIVLDILFKTIVPSNLSFGFPFYAIPLVIGSIVLGPIYGGVMGFLSDAIGFFAAPKGDYNFIFALQAISWGIVPFLIARRNSKIWRVSLAILVTHIIASTLSTFADFMFQYLTLGKDYEQALMIAGLNVPLRLMMMPVNIVIISFITYQVNMRLEPLYVEFFHEARA